MAVNIAEEVLDKLMLARRWMQDVHVSALVLSSQANFAWISAGGRSHISTGEAGGVASVVITQQAASVLTTNIEATRLVEEELPEGLFSLHQWPWYEGDGRRELSQVCDPATAVSDLGSFGLPVAGEGFRELRRSLAAPEVDRFRSLGRDAGNLIEETCRSVAAGNSELDIAAEVASRCYARDILPLVILVAADERIAAYRHPLPTPKPLQSTLLVSLSARRHGLHVSLTRMLSLQSPSGELLHRHRATASVDSRLILESRPGSTLGSVFQKGLSQYSSEGFPDEWRLHHQGGLTGYAGREIFAGPKSPHVLKSTQAVAWNPSITGAKSEDTVLVTAGEPEILTRTGNWPELSVSLDSGTLPRPALLFKQ